MIEVNGTDYPVRYSMKALKKFERKAKVNVFSLSDPSKLSAEACAYLCFVGVECGCDFEGVEFTMELAEFEEHITLAHVTQCFDVLGEYSDQKKIDGTNEPIGWPEMIRMGMGVLRLSPSAFWSMTFAEISLALDGHREAEEYRERYAWERVRWLGAMTFQPHLKKAVN